MKNRGWVYLSSVIGGIMIVLGLISCGQVTKETSGGAAGVGAAKFTSGATVTTSGVRAAGASAFADGGSITGRITDCFTGDPIVGATVYAGTSSATTDASGNYSLSGVPVGNVTVTGTKNGYYTICVISAASTINFGLVKLYSSADQASYPTGIITGEVLNADGSRLTFGSSTEVTRSIYRYGSINASSSTYNAWGYGSVSSNGTYEMTAPAGSLYLSLSRYESIYDSSAGSYSWASLPGVVKTGVTLSSGERKTVNFQLPASYGTIEGTLSYPAGYNYSSGYMSAAILEGNLGASVGYKTLASGESTYSLLVPPTENSISYALIATSLGSSTTGIFGGIAFNYGVTISGGARQTKNFTLLSPPQLVSPSHNATSVSVTGETFSWTKPSDWDPDFYALQITESYGSTAGFNLMVLIPKDVTSFQLPAQLNLTPEKGFYWGIAAVKSSGADVNSFNLRTISIENASFMARYFTSGRGTNVLARIAVTPSSASVIKGQQQQFTAAGYDSYNNSVSLSSTTWTVTDRWEYSDSRWTTLPGSINSSGLFTATSEGTASSYPRRGLVKAQSGSVSGTAVVTVEAAVTTTTQGTTTTTLGISAL